jgi:hypothetical protein
MLWSTYFQDIEIGRRSPQRKTNPMHPGIAGWEEFWSLEKILNLDRLTFTPLN